MTLPSLYPTPTNAKPTGDQVIIDTSKTFNRFEGLLQRVRDGAVVQAWH